MGSSENDGSSKQDARSNVHEEANIYEDETNLIDYFRVIWKRKRFVFLASVLPALVVGLVIFLLPRDCRISYTYNVRLDEKSFKALEDKFYSTENLEKLIENLQEDGFKSHAEKLGGTETGEGLKKIVSFEISPSYFEAIKPSEARNFEELEKIQQAQGTLLVMRLGARSGENIRGIASVCRENFEQIIPMYSVREELNSEIISLKEEMAGIEEARYMLNLRLEREKSTLEELKSSGSEGSEKLPSDIVLQFNNVGESSVFLPLVYQVQAAETQIINLEEQIRADKEKHDYNTGLLTLNGALFSKVKEAMSSRFTLEQFHAFLIDTLAETKEDDKQILDYLNAYIKRIENKIANTIPLVEKPKVYPVAKGAAKKSAMVFVLALMVSMFGAFLSEGLEKSQSQTS